MPLRTTITDARYTALVAPSLGDTCSTCLVHSIYVFIPSSWARYMLGAAYGLSREGRSVLHDQFHGKMESILHDDSACTRIDGVRIANVHTPYTNDDARSWSSSHIGSVSRAKL